jgi:type IV pilus assembly protein PilQ
MGLPGVSADSTEPAASEALDLEPSALPVEVTEPAAEEPVVDAPAEATAETPVDASADAAGEAPVEDSATEVLAPASAPAASAGAVDTKGLVSVDFKDADIRQVLRILSLKSGVDIVAGNDVEGLVTIKLTNIPWEQALDIILRTYGFTYDRKGNIVRVLTLESLEQEALSTEVFPLSYAKAKAVPDVVNEMLSDRGRIKFDERTNTVIVTDIPSTLFQVKLVIERLDQRTPQVLIATKIVETTLDKNEALGINWSPSQTYSTSTVEMSTTFPFVGGKSLGKLGELFIPRPSTTSARVPDSGGTFNTGTLSATGLSAVIAFLNERSDTKVLSNPSIAVLDNQEARVHIGLEYPIPNYTVDPTTGRTTITGFNAKQLGTVLTVTPHVNQSREIVASIKPEITASGDLVTYDTGSSNSVTLPQFSIQTASTQVRVKDGETVAIGGLVKESESKIFGKVPFLGDLPILGALFTRTDRYAATGSSDPVRQDLLIFVTMSVIDESQPRHDVAAVPAEAK